MQNDICSYKSFWIESLEGFILLKGLTLADLGGKTIYLFFGFFFFFYLHEFLLFYVRLLCSDNFCFGPVEM